MVRYLRQAPRERAGPWGCTQSSSEACRRRCTRTTVWLLRRLCRVPPGQRPRGNGEADPRLALAAWRNGVPEPLVGCYTTLIDGHFERPAITGIFAPRLSRQLTWDVREKPVLFEIYASGDRPTSVRSGEYGCADPIACGPTRTPSDATDRVRKPGPLAHQQQEGAMQHHHALLLRSLHGKRMVGRLTASQIASASAASFFWRLT
jgi:hypothetical protein